MINVKFVNPHNLISRQIPIEMSGSKIKRLRKKMNEIGFNPEYPIEKANLLC